MTLRAVSSAGSNLVNSGVTFTTYTPTLTTVSGSLGTASATGRFAQIGKIITIDINITITANGTGAGAVNATLPINVAGGQTYILVGRETNSYGGILQAQLGPSSPGLAAIFKLDNTYPGGNNVNIVISGSYESA